MTSIEQGGMLPQPQQDPTLIAVQAEGELVVLRNRAIEAILNPEGTLPGVVLVDRYERSPRQSQRSGLDTHNYAIIANDGVHIGKARVDVPYGFAAEREDVEACIDVVGIYNADYLRGGFGKSTYLELLKLLPMGLELACDQRGVTPDALKIWQWLEAHGLASRPAELGEPAKNTRGTYENLSYRTCLASLVDFSAER